MKIKPKNLKNNLKMKLLRDLQAMLLLFIKQKMVYDK